jgi:hypothetical protein
MMMECISVWNEVGGLRLPGCRVIPFGERLVNDRSYTESQAAGEQKERSSLES